MSVDLYWDDDEQTVLLCEISDGWTWEELEKLFTKVEKLSAERGQTFGALLDLSGCEKLSTGSIFSAGGLRFFKQITRASGDRGPMVVVGANPLINTVYRTASQLDASATKDTHFAATIDQARELIYPMMLRYQK